MSSNGRASLIAFERQADEFIKALPILKLPARAVLSTIHFSLFTMIRAVALGLPSAAPQGDALMSRLGYLLPLLQRLAAVPIGVDGTDALAGYRDADPDYKQLGVLYSYAHFSQIMPEFHRGYFEAEITQTGFQLSHKSTEFAEAEAKDILLSEIALPHFNERPPLPDDDVVSLAWSAPNCDLTILIAVLKRKFERWRTNLAEPPLITDDGLRTIFGFDHSTFKRIQAAVLAYAEFCDELGWLIGGWSARDNGGNEISPEALEWITVNNIPDFLINFISLISGTEQKEVLSFLNYYCIDYTAPESPSRGGDGFLPPFAKFDGIILFSPVLAMTFVQARNAIFDFSRLNKKDFDDRVSHELEPVLLDQLITFVEEKTNWIVHPNVHMIDGEIDLLICDPENETFLILQAKGPLPPQGARMASRLATRCQEGLDQLDRFRALPDNEKLARIAEKSGYKLSSSNLLYALLARSCFGSPNIWSRDNDTILLTLPLARIAIARLAATSSSPSLSTFPITVRAVREEFLTAAKPVWSHGQIRLIDKEITVPLLQFNNSIIKVVRDASSGGTDFCAMSDI